MDEVAVVAGIWRCSGRHWLSAAAAWSLFGAVVSFALEPVADSGPPAASERATLLTSSRPAHLQAAGVAQRVSARPFNLLAKETIMHEPVPAIAKAPVVATASVAKTEIPPLRLSYGRVLLEIGVMDLAELDEQAFGDQEMTAHRD